MGRGIADAEWSVSQQANMLKQLDPVTFLWMTQALILVTLIAVTGKSTGITPLMSTNFQ